jgi:hypothetical protein
MKNIATRLVLLLSTLCLLTSAQAQPGSACPPRPKGRFFGYFVFLTANAEVGGAKNDSKKEETCWVSGLSASGQNRLESHGQYAGLTTEYSYAVGPTGISASARLYGQVNNTKMGGGSGHADLWLMWHDTLTFHSKTLSQVTAGDFHKGNPKAQDLAAGSQIKVAVRYMQSPPQCSGEKDKFQYQTGVVAAFYGVLGGGGVGPPGEVPKQAPNGTPVNGDNWFIRSHKCGIPSGSSLHYIEVANGYDFFFQITVDAETAAYLAAPDYPEGHLKVELSGMRMCIVRPEWPKDLTITSASGTDYSCPAGSFPK